MRPVLDENEVVEVEERADSLAPLAAALDDLGSAIGVQTESLAASLATLLTRRARFERLKDQYDSRRGDRR